MFTVSSTLIWAVLKSSYRSNRLGLSHWDTYAVSRVGCLELYYCNMVEWFWWDSSLISTTNWFPSVLWHCWFGHLACKNRPWNDLYHYHYHYYCNLACTNESWSHTKNQSSLNYFTGNHPTKKVGVNRHFQAEPLSQWDACSVIVWTHRCTGPVTIPHFCWHMVLYHNVGYNLTDNMNQTWKFGTLWNSLIHQLSWLAYIPTRRSPLGCIASGG